MEDFDDGSVCTMDTDDSVSKSDPECIKSRLLACVAKSDGFFRNQQIGEKDLTFEEKLDIAGGLLDRNVSLFLQRYWKFIPLDDVGYFDPYCDDYEVNFYVGEIKKLKNSKAHKVKVRNRRYEALKQMVGEGSYFSDREMRRRNPFMYDEMIGKHLSEQERVAAYKEDHPDEKLVKESLFKTLKGLLKRNEVAY